MPAPARAHFEDDATFNLTAASGQTAPFKIFPYDDATVTVDVVVAAAPNVFLEATNKPTADPDAWSAIKNVSPVSDGSVITLDGRTTRYLWYRFRWASGDGTTDVNLYMHRWRVTATT